MPAAIDDVLIPGVAVDKQRLRDYLRGREVAVPQSFGGIPDGVTDCSDAMRRRWLPHPPCCWCPAPTASRDRWCWATARR